MSLRKSLLILLALIVLACLPAANPAAADFPRSAVPSKSLSPAAASDLRVGANFLVSNESSLVEVRPALAYDASRQQYLATWYNDRPGNDDIRAQRIARDGTLLGGPFYVSAAGEGIDRRDPAVVYNSKADQFLVVWEHQEASYGYSIHGRRVSGTGQVLDANDLVIRSAGANLYTPAAPAVAYAYTSDKYLVVWAETWHPLPITSGIYGQVVLSNGALSGGVLTINEEASENARKNPDLAYNIHRNEYLVVWEQYTSGTTLTDLYLRRVTGEGAPLQPASTVLAYYTAPSTAPQVAALPIAPDGQYLVVWELHYAANDWDIYAKPVSADGAPGSQINVAITGADESAPDVAASPGRGQYLVSYSRLPNPSFIWTDLQGQMVSAAGGLVGDPIAMGGLLADHPSLAAGPVGDFLAVFEDTPLAADSGIYGQLVGNRLYLPLAVK